MSVLKNHTRFDVMGLHRQGLEFLKVLNKNHSLSQQKNIVRAWLNQVERLNNDDIDANQRMMLDSCLIDLREFYDKNKPMVVKDFITTVSRLVNVISAIRYNDNFKPIGIDNDVYSRFLRATVFEDSKLGLGRGIALINVAKTARIEMTVARQCLAKLVDDNLGHESKDEEDSFFIEKNQVLFCLDEFSSVSSKRTNIIDQSIRQKADKEWDVFICHASEDKESFVRLLVEVLQRSGIRVWYDEFSLTLGDSLRRSIDKGLLGSRFGIVVLSHQFFDKDWPQMELDGLVQREVNGRKVILPIWHGVNRDDIINYSPMLADRFAVKSSEGIKEVVNQILRVVRNDREKIAKDKEVPIIMNNHNTHQEKNHEKVKRDSSNELADISCDAANWISRLNSLYQNEIRIYCQNNLLPNINFNGQYLLSENQKAVARNHYKLLKKANRPNDQHAILIADPIWDSDPVNLDVKLLDFSGVNVLRQEGIRPQILSSCGIIVCGDTEELILHTRDHSAATYPSAIHTIGGAYLPNRPGGGDPDLRSTIEREVHEETQLNLSSDHSPPMIMAKELSTGFIQLVFLGFNVSAQALKRIHKNWEGQVTRIKFDNLPNILQNEHWVPTGKVHVLAWLALGCPGVNYKPKFKNLSPIQLFDINVPSK